MKGMKRITTLLLAGSMALTFSACVRNDRINTEGSDIEEKHGKLLQSDRRPAGSAGNGTRFRPEGVGSCCR